MQFEIDTRLVARRIIGASLALQAVVLVGDIVLNYLDVFDHISIRRIFNIAREESFPTWFASTQALAVSLTAAGLWRMTRRRGWAWVSAFFLYVSIDDAAEVHERVSTALSDTFPTLPLLSDYPSFSWHLLIAPILAAGLLAVAAFMWRVDPSRRTKALVVAGLAAFAVSQGIDVLEGVDGLFEGWASDLGVADYTVGHGFRTVEEMLEMLGTLALWAPMLGLASQRLGTVSIETVS